jgi:hypothetical protein
MTAPYLTVVSCKPVGVGGGTSVLGGVGCAVTVKVTGMVTDDAPLALSVIVPL